MIVGIFFKKLRRHTSIWFTPKPRISPPEEGRLQDLRKGNAGRRFLLNGSHLSAAVAPCSGVVAGPETADFLDFFRNITAGICGSRE
jgi:hypothetical protein